MKVGDSILCIDNRITGIYLKERFIVGLTKDKWYTIVNITKPELNSSSYITIKDDFNNNQFFSSYRFITLDEFRDRKLRELGI